MRDIADVIDETTFSQFVGEIRSLWKETPEIGMVFSPNDPHCRIKLGPEGEAHRPFINAAYSRGMAARRVTSCYRKPVNRWQRVAQTILLGVTYE